MTKEILIVKILGIGDVVMSLSIVEWIQRFAPETKITWVVGKNSAELLTPFKSFITPIVIDEQRLFSGSLFQRLYELFSIWRSLFNKKFDLILTLHPDTRFRLISIFSRAKEYRSFTRKGRLRPNPSRHFSNEYLNLYLNIDSPSSQNARLPDFEAIIHNTRMKDYFKANSQYVCLSIGGARNSISEAPLKRWPIEHYLSIAQKLCEKEIYVILLGSSSDIEDSKKFSELKNSINLVGKTTLLECIEVISYSHALVAHDTGILHLGSLTKTPIIALFGPTNPANFSPIRQNTTLFWGGKHLACRPCYDGKTFSQCAKNECMISILPEDVLNQLNIILSQ